MEEVQNLKSRNTAPSSKTFRDEPYFMFMNVCCYNRCHGNTVEGFWALWDNIYDCMLITLYLPVILDGQFTSSSECPTILTFDSQNGRISIASRIERSVLKLAASMLWG
jgi:hypothetical protein